MSLKIMVPVDGTEEALAGVVAAGRIALAVDADVTLVHALYPGWFRYLLVPEPVSGVLLERERAAVAVEIDKAESVLKAIGITPGVKVFEGRPEGILSKIADKYDLLVLGSRVHSDIWEVLVGTVPSELIRLASKPVLVIKQNGPPPDSIARHGKLRVLCAVDETPVSERCVKFIEKLGPPESLTVTLLHTIGPKSLGIDRMTAEERFDTLRKAHAGSEGLLEKLAKKLRGSGYHVSTEVLEGDASVLACRVREEEDYDFVIVGRHAVGDITARIFDSVSHHLFHHCDAHQLIVP